MREEVKLVQAVKSGQCESLDRYMKEYERSGEPRVISFRDECSWIRGADRYTHLIHRYTAKLLPHIPGFFLGSTLCPSKATILDPFTGSGTVLLEAMLAGHRALGIEINPVARLIARVKTTVFDATLLEGAANAVLNSIACNNHEPQVPDFPNRALWFSEKVQNGLAKVRACVENVDDPKLRDFFWVVFSSLIRRVALADPRVSPPVVLKPSKFASNSPRYKKVCRMVEERTNAEVEALFAWALQESIKRFRRLDEASKENEIGSAEIVWDDARTMGVAPLIEKGYFEKENAHEFPADSVDMAITSPPYMNAQKYARSLRLEWYWLGYGSYDDLRAMDASMIGTERLTLDEYSDLIAVGHPEADNLVEHVYSIDKHRARIVANYFSDMRLCFANIMRVLKPGGHFVLVVGNNRVLSRRVPNHQILADLATSEGFKVVLMLVDEIKSRGLMTKRNTTADVIPDEWVIVFQKP